MTSKENEMIVRKWEGPANNFIRGLQFPRESRTHNCCSARGILSYSSHCVSAYLKGSPYSITERRVPELIPVLGIQPAGDVSHKLGGRLPLLSARPTVTPATLKRAAANFAAW